MLKIQILFEAIYIATEYILCTFIYSISEFMFTVKANIVLMRISTAFSSIVQPFKRVQMSICCFFFSFDLKHRMSIWLLVSFFLYSKRFKKKWIWMNRLFRPHIELLQKSIENHLSLHFISLIAFVTHKPSSFVDVTIQCYSLAEIQRMQIQPNPIHAVYIQMIQILNFEKMSMLIHHFNL